MTLPDISFTEASYIHHNELEWYPATIQHIETAEGQFGPQLKWIINIEGELNDDGSLTEQWAYCSQKLTPRSKLYKWAVGILGKDNVPATLNPSVFIGRPVEIAFERYQGQAEDGSPVEKEKIVKMRARNTGTTTVIGAPTISAQTVAPAPAEDPLEMPF